jgi:hypothetical protein
MFVIIRHRVSAPAHPMKGFGDIRVLSLIPPIAGDYELYKPADSPEA